MLTSKAGRMASLTATVAVMAMSIGFVTMPMAAAAPSQDAPAHTNSK